MAAYLQEFWPQASSCNYPGTFGASAASYAEAMSPIARVANVRPAELRFGSCRLLPGARLLLRDGKPIALGSRAFDLLYLLLTRRGDVVAKTAIFAFVWPDTFVAETNLRFQMMTLRKALGEDRALIKTIPGRGYVLVDDYDGRD